MSRIGKQTIHITPGVTVETKDGILLVRGPKGTLSRIIPSVVTIAVVDQTVVCSVTDENEKSIRSLWGTYAAHTKNMIEGVTKGFQKQLEVNGVGYRVAMQGSDVLKLELGFSHPVMYKLPQGITATVEKNLMTINSCDKELLGKVCADIRAQRPPEPYKGKGIKYVQETIRRKAGKTASKG